ncbi:MAG: hypothetical protein M1832_004561 [Thelocarpon impressellum]|nr:MAG: hypothetical protein M1832_004561 [Thelocarpon impressellum]
MGAGEVPRASTSDAAAAESPADEKDRRKRYNTGQLGLRLASDAGAAALAAVLVAPLITIIDRGIIENASRRDTLAGSVRASLREMLLRPHRFFLSRPFGLVSMLYFGTYATANVLDTTAATLDDAPPTTTTTGPAKFLATSSVNLTLCLYKDTQFARLFGPLNSLPRPLAPATYAAFALRDCLTVFASFNVPPLLAARLPLSDAFDAAVLSRASAAQLLAPAAMQVLSTPLHLLGLDLYNRPARDVAWSDRARRIGRDWAKSCVARVCRIVPAFGVGGVVNLKVRRGLMGAVLE